MPTPNRTAPEARAESLRETAAKLNGENTFDLRFLVESPGMKAKRESLRTKRHRRAVETQLTRIADAAEDIAVTSHTLALLAERVADALDALALKGLAPHGHHLVGARFNALVDQIAGRG